MDGSFPSLCTGEIIPSFQMFGKIPTPRERLNSTDKGEDTSSTDNLSNIFVMPSGPQLFQLARFRITVATAAGEISSKVKRGPSGGDEFSSESKSGLASGEVEHCCWNCLLRVSAFANASVTTVPLTEKAPRPRGYALSDMQP